uniref:Uncharacterized protein n=1 Tax=Anguilla anguilla TaxID=7936 RepID=A0A0E9TXF3_ANGAN
MKLSEKKVVGGGGKRKQGLISELSGGCFCIQMDSGQKSRKTPQNTKAIS